MRQRIRWIRATVAAATAVLTLAAPIAAQASGTSSLHGRLALPGSGEPVAGARLLLQDASGGPSLRSAPTDARGAYAIEALPPGRYHAAVRLEERLYPMERPVRIRPSTDERLDLVLVPAASDEPEQAAGSIWSRPSYATLIVVGSAVAAGLILEAVLDEDTTVSPITP